MVLCIRLSLVLAAWPAAPRRLPGGLGLLGPPVAVAKHRPDCTPGRCDCQ